MTIYLKKGLFPSCFVWQYCLKCQRGLFVHFQINSEFWRNVAPHFVNLGFYANCDIQIHITLLFGHSGIYLSLTYKIEMLQFYSGSSQQENSLRYCRTTFRLCIQNTKYKIQNSLRYCKDNIRFCRSSDSRQQRTPVFVSARPPKLQDF